MSRFLGIHCKPKKVTFITVILLLMMTIFTIYQYTCDPEKSCDWEVLRWTEMKTGYGTAVPLNKTEKERKETEQKNVYIIRAVGKKMPFLGRRYVNPHPFKYIHNVPDACRQTNVELLIGIHTRTNGFASRKAIRETWGQKNEIRKTMTIFFIGTTSNKTVQKEIDNEALKYGDIVQEDFVDTYQNLSLKSVALVRWVSLYCPNSTFVLKADDDVYVNVPLLLSAVQEHYRWSHLFILGKLHVDSSPVRNAKSKFYLSPNIYPFNKFPSYFSGSAYAMTTTAAMKLYIESFYVSPIFIDDVYLTGLVADRAAVPKFWDRRFYPGKTAPEGCEFKNRISGHSYNATFVRKIHWELWDEKRNCSALLKVGSGKIDGKTTRSLNSTTTAVKLKNQVRFSTPKAGPNRVV